MGAVIEWDTLLGADRDHVARKGKAFASGCCDLSDQLFQDALVEAKRLIEDALIKGGANPEQAVEAATEFLRGAAAERRREWLDKAPPAGSA